MSERRIRWHGDPHDAEQPDTGDVLSYVDPHGERPDTFELVHHGWRVRGGQPWDLWLMVTPVELDPDGSIPEVIADAILDGPGRCFPAHKRRRPRRRR